MVPEVSQLLEQNVPSVFHWKSIIITHFGFVRSTTKKPLLQGFQHVRVT